MWFNDAWSQKGYLASNTTVILASSYLLCPLLHIIITFTITFSHLFLLLLFYTFQAAKIRSPKSNTLGCTVGWKHWNGAKHVKQGKASGVPCIAFLDQLKKISRDIFFSKWDVYKWHLSFQSASRAWSLQTRGKPTSRDDTRSAFHL